MNLLSETRERALLLRECKDSGATIRIAIYIDLLDANRNSKCARTDGDIPNERWSQKFHAVANAPLVAVDESPPHSGVGTTEEKTHFHAKNNALANESIFGGFFAPFPLPAADSSSSVGAAAAEDGTPSTLVLEGDAPLPKASLKRRKATKWSTARRWFSSSSIMQSRKSSPASAMQCGQERVETAGSKRRETLSNLMEVEGLSSQVTKCFDASIENLGALRAMSDGELLVMGFNKVHIRKLRRLALLISIVKPEFANKQIQVPQPLPPQERELLREEEEVVVQREKKKDGKVFTPQQTDKGRD